MTYEPTTAEYVRAATEASFSEHELNPSMRDFANRIAYDACAKLRAKLQAEGWRQCAKGQGTSQFCGQLEAAVLAEREACADLCDSLYPPCNDPGDCAKAIRARSKQ